MVKYHRKNVGRLKKMTNKKIVRKIEETYKIKVKNISLLRESSDNVVYLIVSDKNKKFVLRISKRDMKDDVLFEIVWLDYLSQHSVPVVKIVKTENRGFSSILGKFVLIMFKFAEGKPIEIKPDSKPDLENVKNAACELAKLHNVSLRANIDLPRKRNILTEVNRALKIKNKFIFYSEGGAVFVDELSFYKKWVKKNENTKYLLHNDYRVSNIFFKNKAVSVIMDFDWSCKGPAIKDVAHSLAEWSFPDGAEEHWEDVFNTFLNSYNKEAKNKVDINNTLFNWICFSCLSDTATYLVDLTEKGIFKRISSSYMYRKYLYFKKFTK